MFSFKKKIIILISVSSVFLILVTFFILKNYNHKIYLTSIAKNISASCEVEERNKCLRNEIMNYVKINPKDSGKVLEIFENEFLDISNEKEVDFLINFVHDIGMYFVWNKISVYDSFQYCGVSFMQGCIHGVVMQYADDFNVIEKNLLVELCDNNSLNSVVYLNCIHGVGHVLASKNKINIDNVTKFCDGFEDWREKTACGSGFFMEYSKDGAGKGHHSEKPLGAASLNCLGLNGLYFNMCEIYQKHYLKNKLN